jgi:anaerobic magnesium-protoporphyrin IX monomethyl ester cyclase
MKTTLIYLPHPYLSQPDSQAPLGLMYLASVLRNNDIDVQIKNYTSFSTDEAINDLTESDIFGITSTSVELLQANRFAKRIKDKFPNSYIIIGGPGTYSDEFIDWSVIDSICKGEAEKTILDIVSDIKHGKPKKIYNGDPVIDLDTIPPPARDLLGDNQGGNIFAYNHRYKEGQTTIILTSRGCAFSCAFCSAPRARQCGKVIRYRSPQNILYEIESVMEEFNIQQFRISDDMFTQNAKHVKNFCDVVAPLDIAWRISCRVKPFSKEIACMLKNAGCKEVSFGIESFDDDVLKLLKKGTTSRDNIKALEICREVGLKTRALMMIGTPGQTKDTVKTNINILEKVPYDIVSCTIFMPLPGSEIWVCPEKFGIKILDKNLDNYNFYFFGNKGENEIKNVIKIHGRSQKEVKNEIIEFRNYLKNTNKINKGL